MNPVDITPAVQRAIDAAIAAPVVEPDDTDYGFAEGDTTSVWIVRTGEKLFI